MVFVSKKRGAFLRGIFMLLFFIFPCFLSAQIETDSAADETRRSIVIEEETQDQSQSRSGRETDESLILIDSPYSSSNEPTSSAAGTRSYSSAGAVLRLIAVLVLLCVACYFIIRFLKKSQRATSASDPFLKITASLSLEQGKSVAVVTLGSRAFLLGVADHSISLIAEITDSELIDQMNLSGGINFGRQKPFAEILSELLPKSRQKADSSSTEETANFIRERRVALKDRRRDEQ